MSKQTQYTRMTHFGHKDTYTNTNADTVQMLSEVSDKMHTFTLRVYYVKHGIQNLLFLFLLTSYCYFTSIR